jgi:hypothetical protein
VVTEKHESTEKPHTYTIQYKDGVVEKLDLAKQQFRIIDENDETQSATSTPNTRIRSESFQSAGDKSSEGEDGYTDCSYFAIASEEGYQKNIKEHRSLKW